MLTAEAPLAFESTSGTVRGAKLIPYTPASLVAFRAGVLPWLAHLLEQRPRIADGVAYVAASPVARRKAAFACRLPVGLASDAAYLGAELAPVLAQVVTRPPPFADLARWRVGTLAHLAAHRDLTLISIWSPTFLLELLEALPREAAHVRVALYEAGDPAAAHRVERALAEPGGLVRHLWPKLQAVSMWMDGPSAPYAARVGELLPGVYLDGKGVLATESVLTVRQSNGCVPALTSAFIEFLDGEGRSFLAHEIVAGRRYRTVITTPGGLYRYDLGDVLAVRVAGRHRPDAALHRPRRCGQRPGGRKALRQFRRERAGACAAGRRAGAERPAVAALRAVGRCRGVARTNGSARMSTNCCTTTRSTPMRARSGNCTSST